MTRAEKAVTKKDVMRGLHRLGLTSGDHVLVHSAISSFGGVEGGADTVVDALIEVVGSKGTVMVPTFDSMDEVFDPEKSGTILGKIPVAVMKRGDAVRSRHPLASVAAIGRKASWFVKDHEKAKTPHGPGTPYYRLYETGGKILLLGVDQDRSTFLHTVENFANLPYLRKSSAAYRDASGRKKTGTWSRCPGPHRDFIGLQRWLEERGLTRKTLIGSCVAQLMPCMGLLDTLLERLREEPALFITDNPNRPDGVWQRGDVWRAMWRRQTFQLVADSGYAGSGIEEIIDNLGGFGIDNILLTSVHHVPWHRIGEKRRKWYLQGLRGEKIRVAGIRLPVVADVEQVEGLLREAKTGSVIVPSTCDIEAVEKLARKGHTVLMENAGVKANRMVELFNDLPKQWGARVRSAYHPLNFVQVGEEPFLQSYQTRLRHMIGMLFVHDGLGDGHRVELERGLAEIKELISILCAKSFDGAFVLQGVSGARFRETVEKFAAMLDEVGALRK